MVCLIFNGNFPILISLGIIAVVILASIVCSLLFPHDVRGDEKGGRDTSPKIFTKLQPFVWHLVVVALALLVVVIFVTAY